MIYSKSNVPYMLKYYFYFLFVIILGACNNATTSEKESRPSQQHNSIEYKKTDTLTPVSIYVNDMSLFKDKNITFKFYYLDSVFQATSVSLNKRENLLHIYSPTFLIQSDSMQIPYLLYPSEKIEVENKDNRLILAKPGDEERTNELNFFRELIIRTGALRFIPVFEKTNFDFINQKAKDIQGVKKFETEIQQKEKERIDFLNTYATANKVSSAFKDLASHVILSSTIQLQLIMYWKNKEILQQNNVYDNMVNSCLTKLNNIPFKPHAYYLQAAMDIVSVEITKKYVHHLPVNMNEFIQYYNFIRDHTKSELRDFLMALSFDAAIKRNINIPESNINDFYKNCIDSNYKNIVAGLIKDKKTPVNYNNKGDNFILVNDTTIRDMQTIISKEKGNLILLDFWASWCPPCRAEMPASAKLKKEYGGKPVKFIYISTDDNKKAWLKACKEEELDSSDSYLFINAAQAPFAKQYKINTIPRYMLIGKDGTIIDADAPRPSDPKLKELIDKYLK